MGQLFFADMTKSSEKILQLFLVEPLQKAP